MTIQSVTKTYAVFNVADRGRFAQEITDTAEAIKTGMEINAFCFSTYQVDSIELDEQVFTTKEKNHSMRQFLNVEQVITNTAYIALQEQYKQRLLSGDIQPDMTGITKRREQKDLKKKFAEAVKNEITAVENWIERIKTEIPETAMWAKLPTQWILLSEGEKAYDRSGKQVYPLPTAAPKTDNSPAAP